MRVNRSTQTHQIGLVHSNSYLTHVEDPCWQVALILDTRHWYYRYYWHTTYLTLNLYLYLFPSFSPSHLMGHATLPSNGRTSDNHKRSE
jgi:hypothetical protein